ncbi:hypothetical protein Pfo_016543 [Paulownia fortunei]|nr:hypothetical protein Pfo_016543 [Paulownia fortunei]
MEKEGKKKKQRNEKKESCEKRSPLQDLNGIPIHKPNSKKRSNLSSSSAAAVSGEAPKGCLKFLLSSNTCSSSSSPSSSRTHLDKKSKTFSKIANNEPKKSTADTSKVLPRSKENEIPTKSFPQRSKRNRPQSLTQRQYSKSNAKSLYKNGQRSKLSSVQGNPVNKLKKGSEEFRAKMKNSQENGSVEQPFELLGVANGSNLNCAEIRTPVGKVASGSCLDSVNFSDHKTVIEDSIYMRANGNSATAVKTPPVEASLSPEIQCQSHSKILVLKSAATPVCYGAGHLVSGVTDKRKCRRRGSLKGGCDKANLFDDEMSDGNVTNDLPDISIPLLAEASVRWLLSPCDEGHEDQRSDSINKIDQCKIVCDNASGTLDLLSSPSILCGNASDLLCADSSYSGSGSVGNAANNMRSRNVILSPRKATEFQQDLEPSNNNMDEFLFATSPNAAYSCNGISSREGKHFSNHLIGDNSTLSIGSLNSGNMIQTPNSDSSSEVCVGRSRLEEHHSNFVRSELDSITETLNRVNLSPRNEMSMWDTPGLGFHFADMASPPSSDDLNILQKNVDSVSSWVSNTTLDNFALSQMRISWRDGLASRIVETDEFDCCCFLSDEEIDADGSAGGQLMLYPPTEAGEDKETYLGSNSAQRSYPGVESVENNDNDLRIDNDLSPMLLDYEPCVSTREKEKSSPHRPNTCAESICTDGGGLVASNDSDWTYCHENHLFQVK